VFLHNVGVVKTIAAISLVYDLAAGLALLAFPQILPTWLDIPLPEPAIFLELNGLFLIAVAVGYALPYREPERYRAYLWVFGVGLKSAGAAAFVIDATWRGGPAAMWLFAAGDAVMAGLSLVALRAGR
jgi:hypothetical protein